MAGGRGLSAPRSVCIVLYFYLCFTNYSFQKSKQHQSQASYTSSVLDYQTRNFGATRSNGLVSNSTRVLLGCRLMLNAPLSLLLIQLVNDVEIQPGPGQAHSLNGLRICQWNVKHLTGRRPSKDQDRLDILILSETFRSQKVPDFFYGIRVFQLHRKDRVRKSGGKILWLEICPYQSKRPLFTSGIYRPPSCRSADDKKPGKNIENVHLLNKEITLLRDIDIDYLCNMKFGKHPFIKTLHNLNLFQLVKVITRPLSKACLDHVWSSHPERRINVQVFPSGLSDHLPTIATRKNKPAVQSTVVLQQSPTVTSTTRIKNSLLLL